MPPPQRMEFRITLAHIDRDVQVAQPLILSRHASESSDHVVLRVLSWCLLYDEAMTFGPGICVGDAPDLEARDLIGATKLWIASGDADVELVKKVLQHHSGASVHVVWGDERRRDEFFASVAKLPRLPRGWERLSLWLIDPALVRALGARESLRQRWTVTISGDVFYIEADGQQLEGAVTPVTSSP